jgi:hypothetical protein
LLPCRHAAKPTPPYISLALCVPATFVALGKNLCVI